MGLGGELGAGGKRRSKGDGEAGIRRETVEIVRLSVRKGARLEAGDVDGMRVKEICGARGSEGRRAWETVEREEQERRDMKKEKNEERDSQNEEKKAAGRARRSRGPPHPNIRPNVTPELIYSSWRSRKTKLGLILGRIWWQ